MGIGVSVTFDELYVPREAAAHGLRSEDSGERVQSRYTFPARSGPVTVFFFFGHDATNVERKEKFSVLQVYSERSIFLVGRRIFATFSLLSLSLSIRQTRTRNYAGSCSELWKGMHMGAFPSVGTSPCLGSGSRSVEGGAGGFDRKLHSQHLAWGCGFASMTT